GRCRRKQIIWPRLVLRSHSSSVHSPSSVMMFLPSLPRPFMDLPGLAAQVQRVLGNSRDRLPPIVADRNRFSPDRQNGSGKAARPPPIRKRGQPLGSDTTHSRLNRWCRWPPVRCEQGVHHCHRHVRHRCKEPALLTGKGGKGGKGCIP